MPCDHRLGFAMLWVMSETGERADISQADLEQLREDLDVLLAVATLYEAAFSEDEMVTLPERLRLQQVEDVLERRGRRY
jgi:hypothetical protein